MATEKPKAEVIEKHVFQARVGNQYCEFKTKEEAEDYAKEWEAREVAEWERRNSQATLNTTRNERFWLHMEYFIRDLKTQASQAGKNGREVEVQVVRNIRERIEGEMNRSTEESERINR